MLGLMLQIDMTDRICPVPLQAWQVPTDHIFMAETCLAQAEKPVDETPSIQVFIMVLLLSMADFIVRSCSHVKANSMSSNAQD